MGHHRVPDHVDDRRAAVRQAVGHLRPQAAVHARDRDLRGRLRAVRPGHLDVRAGRLPRLPGHRRGRHHAAGAGRHRRHHPAPRARPLPGLHDGRLRQLLGARAGARRPAVRDERLPRRRRVAVDLLHQRAHRRRRAGRHRPGAQARLRPPRAAHRLVGLAPAGRRAGAAAGGGRAGTGLGLGLGRLVRLLLPRRRGPGPVRLDPAPDGRRRAAAAAAVPQPHLLRRLRPGHHHRHGHVRRPVRHPALPADRQGRLADQVRPAAAADGRPG